mmetsp:Transcript_54182/g.121800  ORF Transcript_54182/g.121800 Transcript_54182/m.121800 type:complete len:284 (-) Transcript_54182:154-1005(-)
MASAAAAAVGFPNLAEHAQPLAIHWLAQAAAFVPCLIVVKMLCPQHKDPWNLADTIVSIVVYPLLTFSAMRSAWQLRGDLESRWRGTTPDTSFFLHLYTARMVLHMFIQCFLKMSRVQFVMMTTHHILSSVCFVGALATGNMHFWACLDGSCEMSTIFLNNLCLSKEVVIGGKELKEMVPTWVIAVNGIGLWLSFLTFRLALFPAWLCYWYRDVRDFPAATWDRSNAIERYLDPAVTGLLFVLSSYWFIAVTRGLLKALGLGGKGKSKASRDGSAPTAAPKQD